MTMDINDHDLFSQVKNGNKLAFQTLFRKYYASMVRFIYRFVKDEDSSEEIAQELFINFWENAPRLEIIISFKSYLYTSARNHALNYLKKNTIREKYHQLSAGSETSESSYDEPINSGVFNNLILKALQTLPEKCREIFMLSKYEGLTYDEIADYMGLSKKTVENQMGIGLKKMREWLQPHISGIFE